MAVHSSIDILDTSPGKEQETKVGSWDTNAMSGSVKGYCRLTVACVRFVVPVKCLYDHRVHPLEEKGKKKT